MNTIELLGEEETFRNIVERGITEFEDNKIDVIRDFAKIRVVGKVIPFRIPFSVLSYVWKSVRFGWVWPPVRATADVVVHITAGRSLSFVHH